MTYKRQGLHSIPDQGNEGSCTAFALCNIINWYKDPKRRASGGEWDYLDWASFFELVNSRYPADLQWALTPDMALKYAKDGGYIEGYRSLTADQKNADTIKKLLHAGYLLLIVLTKVDRKATKKYGILTRNTTPGGFAHSVCACDLDELGDVKFVNSRGGNWGRGGYFSAPDEELNSCISQAYVVLDTDDTAKMDQLLYKKRLSDAVQIISNQRQYGTAEEKEAMNLANTVLRNICLQESHPYNMEKKKLQKLIDQYF